MERHDDAFDSCWNCGNKFDETQRNQEGVEDQNKTEKAGRYQISDDEGKKALAIASMVFYISASFELLSLVVIGFNFFLRGLSHTGLFLRVGLLMMLLAVLAVLTARGIQNRQDWAKYLGYFQAFFWLFAFPIGTILAVVSIIYIGKASNAGMFSDKERSSWLVRIIRQNLSARDLLSPAIFLASVYFSLSYLYPFASHIGEMAIVFYFLSMTAVVICWVVLASTFVRGLRRLGKERSIIQIISVAIQFALVVSGPFLIYLMLFFVTD